MVVVANTAHSCLVPITDMKIKVLYVFVDILIDLDHFIETFQLNFDDQKSIKK
jgi:2-(3-amino-3-carboxypropyl)histidine synthase